LFNILLIAQRLSFLTKQTQTKWRIKMTKTYVKEQKMVKQGLVKKMVLAALLSSVSIFCSQSQATIIGSFDTGVDVNISSNISENEFGTDLFEELVYIEGNASGNNSGSDYSDIILGANESGTMSAAADGQVAGVAGFVQSSWETEGYFYFENNTGSAITVNMTFDITWFANIFTSSIDEEAYATAGVFIEDSYGDSVFEDWIELDSLIEGPGAFSLSDSFAVNFSFDLADGDYEEYFLIVDSFGFAENLQQVPEPTGLLSAGLVILFVMRKRKMTALSD
tara:strand:+ start:1899 stop:2738 length:840 start_codon:yes stop_codon:yes gene_type:complete